jgi:hypothetical protein
LRENRFHLPARRLSEAGIRIAKRSIGFRIGQDQAAAPVLSGSNRPESSADSQIWLASTRLGALSEAHHFNLA